MASKGTPLSNMICGTRGLLSSVTDAGPPEKIMPLGRNRSNASSATLNGAISLYTPASRTRRAISCVTWLPKSTMRMDCVGWTVMAGR